MASFPTGLHKRQNGHGLRRPEGESTTPAASGRLGLCLRTRTLAQPRGGPGSRARPGLFSTDPPPGGAPRVLRAAFVWVRLDSGRAWILAPPGGAAGAAAGRGRRVIYSFAVRVAGLPVFGCLFSGCLGPHALAFHTSPAFDDLSVQPAQGPQRARVPPDPLYAVRPRQTPRWREQPKQSLGGGQLPGGRGGGNGES